MKKILVLVTLVLVLFASAALSGAEPAEDSVFRPAEPVKDRFVLQRMLDFFGEWGEDDLDGMLEYCVPEWQAKQDSPKTKLFALLQNRTPLSLEIEGITPAEEEESFRRILVSAEMEGHNGKDPAGLIFEVWMVRSGDGLWYFDPGCLEYPDRPDLATYPVPAGDPAAAGDPELVLYYNPSGGQYYHIDPNCLCVNPKFQPLAGSFKFSEINDEAYSHLERCNVCGAPFRP